MEMLEQAGRYRLRTTTFHHVYQQMINRRLVTGELGELRLLSLTSLLVAPLTSL